MTDIETIVKVFSKAKIPIHYDADGDADFGVRTLTVDSKSGPTGKCGYSGFVGVFYFNADGDLTEFGAWE